MKQATPIMVAADQDRRTGIVSTLCSLNVPAVPADNLAVDYVWTVEGVPVMGDNKTPSDLMASADDGRLYQQVWDMQQAGCEKCFILLEGEDSLSWDGGFNVGSPDHSWSWEQFDALRESLQEKGVTIVHSYSKARTPFRLKALYNRSRESSPDGISSWQLPIKARPANDLKRNPPIILADKNYRAQIGAIITLFDGCGVPTADALRSRFSFMELLGITEEGLERAKQLWQSMDGVGKTKVKNWEGILKA